MNTQWRWWLSAPALVLVLMVWCQLHGLALGEHAVGLGISFPWAVRISAGWIMAGALLLRFGPAARDTPFAQRRPWTTRTLLVAATLGVTLASEYWLLPSDKLATHWLYERVPVHATFGLLMLGAWLLAQPRQAPQAVPSPPAAPPGPAMLDVLTGTGRTQVRLDEVECLEADRNYINVHTGQRSYLLRQTLASFEKSLGASDFQRIHRSIIVNRSKIRERRRGGVLVLNSGRMVRVSRAFADRLH